MPSIPLKKTVILAALLTLLGAWSAARAQSENPQSQGNSAQSQPAAGGGGRGGRGGPVQGVYKATVTPHWFDNDSKFWYRNALRGGASEFILVDADKAVRQMAFDHDKLAASLSKAAGKEFKGDRLPFTTIEFVADHNAIKFEAADKTWKCDLTSYECTADVPSVEKKDSLRPALPDQTPVMMADADDTFIPDEDEMTSSPEADDMDLSPLHQDQQGGQRQGGRRGGRGGGGGGGGGGGFGGRFGGNRQQDSADGKWTAFIKDSNVFLRPTAGGDEIQLSHDGATNNSYGRLSFSPDSKILTAWRTEPGDDGQVYLVQSSPAGGGRAILTQRPYPQAGDKMNAYELSVFDVDTHQQTKPEVERVDFRSPFVRWRKDGLHFTYEKEDRGHTRFRVIDVDPRTGTVRNVIDDQAKTFIWTENTDAFRGQLRVTTYLDNTDEIIYESERDGWRHLYLYDIKEGKLENQITKGEWLVRGIDQIDRDKRQIWFEANGMNPGQDPYFIHYYRINFDGTGRTALTAGNGTHAIAYSPGDKKYLIDTYSRLSDLPPVTELRRVSDGQFVCKLEEADISELKATGWIGSETFVAKGRDGKTDIYGIIDRPQDFDPSKKYPIVEDIYAGPQGTPSVCVPTAFTGRAGHANYTRAGFIVVQIEGMGTANRSKAFHDVCWHDLADAGFPDRILWMKAAAEKYPYMDTNRVGIYGTSAGGQNAAGAVIFHPEWYKAAVANCGCHDNRIDKSTWNEQWMGYMPHDKIWSDDPDNWFSKSSNIDNAAKLGGKLFLIVGELDHNVPPESTYRLVNALINANKKFDFLVVPNADHGAASPPTGSTVAVNRAYAGGRTLDFLTRNLMGGAGSN